MKKKWNFSVAVKVSTILLVGGVILLFIIGMILKQVPTQTEESYVFEETTSSLSQTSSNSVEDDKVLVIEYLKKPDEYTVKTLPFGSNKNANEVQSDTLPILEEENEEEVPI